MSFCLTKSFGKLFVKGFLNSKYVGRQFLDNTQNTERQISEFSYLNFRVAHTWNGVKFKSITLGGQVNNLLNSLYTANGYTYSYKYGGEVVTENFYYPQAGINFMILFNVKF